MTTPQRTGDMRKTVATAALAALLGASVAGCDGGSAGAPQAGASAADSRVTHDAGRRDLLVAAHAYDLAAGTEVQVNCVAGTGAQYMFNVTVLSGNLRGVTGNFEIPVQPQQLKAPWGTPPACPGGS